MAPPLPATRPKIPTIEESNIPELLKQEKRWLCWKVGAVKANGKFGKVTVDSQTGYNINGRDPGQWLNFATAIDAYNRGVAHGIGFALSAQHPICVSGTPYFVTVLDFDDCVMTMEEIEALWQEHGKPFVEMSPSMKGLHIWALCADALPGGNAGDGRELYSGGRFVTMTGIGAKGSFGECPGLPAIQHAWFSAPAAEPAELAGVGLGDLPNNVSFDTSSANWFDRLAPADKNACLAEILQLSAIIALADTSDTAPAPNWRTVMAACTRSGAPNAYGLCRAWAQTSKRFDADNFDLRWRSYKGG